MNVWRFEMWQSYRSLIIWSLVVSGLTILLMAVYPTYQASAADVLKLLEAYPPQLLAAFGMDPETLFSYSGFYAFVLPFTFLAGSIYASGLGLSIMGREKQAKTSDFLLTKPQARSQIFGQKLLAIMSLICTQAVVFTLAVTLLTWYFEPDALQTQTFWLMTLALPLLELVFASLGVIVAVVIKRLKSTSSLAMSIALSCYVISLLQGILESDALKYVTPFQYFNPTVILKTGNFDWIFVGVAAIVTLVCMSISYVLYTRSDVV